MGQDIINVGIIGAGTVARDNQIPAFNKCPDTEVLAVCDISRERADALALQFGIKKVYYDLTDMLEDKEINAISICTGNSTHESIGIACANSGKSILCEKPMAMNVEQAQNIYDSVKKSGVTFMMGFVNRYRNESMLIREFAESGKFGNIYHARCGWVRRRGTPRGWFTDVNKSGGGPVIDIGVHVIDLTWYLMGRPKPVAVSGIIHKGIGNYETKCVNNWVAGEQTNMRMTTEDAATALIRFENGASLSIDVSWAINGKEEKMFSKIYGTKGGASLNPFELYGEENGYLLDYHPVLYTESGWQPAFENEINHFADCIRNNTIPISSVEDGLIVQKMLNGIYDSASKGCEVKLY